MNTRKTLKTTAFAGLLGGAALFLHACLLPVGDGEGLNESGDVEPPIITLVDIRPLFQSNGCASCHGGNSPSGGLLLNSFENARDAFFIITASDTTPRASSTTPSELLVVPGDPDASHLYKRITSTDANFQMPPTGQRMSAPAIAQIRRWIENGALIVAPDTTNAP